MFDHVRNLSVGAGGFKVVKKKVRPVAAPSFARPRGPTRGTIFSTLLKIRPRFFIGVMLSLGSGKRSATRAPRVGVRMEAEKVRAVLRAFM